MSKRKHRNAKRTSRAVKDFFKNQYPELAIKARISESYPKSPNLKEISVQETHVGNSEEHKILEYIEAKKLIDGVETALKEVKKTNSTFESIVRLSYINNLPVPLICERLSISESNYFRKIDPALNFFAFAYAPWIDLRR